VADGNFQLPSDGDQDSFMAVGVLIVHQARRSGDEASSRKTGEKFSSHLLASAMSFDAVNLSIGTVQE